MLEKQRNKIDEIDKKLVHLFEERMNMVAEIAKIKQDNKLNVFDKNREEKVIEKVQSYVNNKNYERSVSELFKSLMAITKDYQKKIIN